MNRALASFALLLVLAIPPAAHAEQTIHLGDSRPGIDWISLKGKARDLAINARGVVYAIGFDGKAWKWSKTFPSTWGSVGGRFSRVTVTPEGKPWAVSTDSRIYRYNGLWWVPMPGRARDIAAGGGADRRVLAIIDPQGKPRRWDEQASAWRDFTEQNTQQVAGVRIAVDGAGTPWVVTLSGSVLRLEGENWRSLGGNAADIAIGPDGGAYMVGKDGFLYLREATRPDWVRVGEMEAVAVVAVGPQDSPWLAREDGSVLASRLFDTEEDEQSDARRTVGDAGAERTRELQERRARSVSTAAVTSTAPLEFVKVAGRAEQVAIGADGTVFIIAPDGQVLRWSSANRVFIRFPGRLSHIAVDPEGNPWGLNGGRIYRFDGKQWLTVPGSASDIAIGYDGTVMTVDADGAVYRYDPLFDRFKRTSIDVRGDRIAVDPDGGPWLITQEGVIYRCEGIGCVRTTLNGVDIGIGPDGSVFMVSADGQLYRWQVDELTWQRVSAPLGTRIVATGPSGRPWVLNRDDEIYASKFFYRDESGDAAQIAGAGVPTPSTPVSPFTFTKSLLFLKVPLPGGPGACALALKVGANDTVYMRQGCAGTSGIYLYNTSRKRFEFGPIQPPFVFFMTAQSNGRLWYQRTDSQTCVRQRTIGENSFGGVLLDGSHGTIPSYCQDLAVGADDSVFMAGSSTTEPFDDYLYRYDEQAGRFALFSDQYTFRSVGVDPDGHPWVVTTDNRVWRHDGKAFVPLPGRGQPQRRDGDRIAVGPTGVVYLVDTGGRIFKWNATNASFDRVTRSNAQGIAVDADGRPWVRDATFPAQVYRAQ